MALVVFLTLAAVTPKPSQATTAVSGLVAKPAVVVAPRQRQNIGPLRRPNLAARRASATAYERMSSHAARKLLATDFAPVVAPAEPELPLGDGKRILRYFGDYDALVTGGPRDGLVSSTLPLTVPTASGGSQPVNLSLRSADLRYQPANSPVPVAISTSPERGVTLNAINASVAPVTQSHSKGQQAGDGVFYPNVAADTDFVTRVQPRGVEEMWQLRSERSPTTLRLHFSLPLNGRLQRVAGMPGAVEVISGDRRLAFVLPPAATDASGANVPVTASVRGATLVLHVSLHSRHWQFPILVDPVVDQWQWWADGAPNDWIGWSYLASPSNQFSSCGCQGPEGLGLYQNTQPYVSYGAGSYGQWYWLARPNTFIYGAAILSEFHPDGAGVGLTQGIYGAYNGGNWVADAAYYNQFNPPPSLGGSGQWSPNPFITETDDNFPYNVRVFCIAADCGTDVPSSIATNNLSTGVADQIWYGGNTRPLGTYAWAYIGGATIYESDAFPPTITSQSETPSTGWVGNTTVSASITATDEGLGMQSISLTGPGVSTSASANCNGSRTSECPLQFSPVLSFSTAGMPQGIDTLNLTAADVVNNSTSTSGYIGVDTSAPTITPSGSLWDSRGSAISDGAYSLTVNAQNGSSGAPRSGVNTVRVFLDGSLVQSTTICPSPPDPPAVPTCFGGSTAPYTVRGEDLGVGKHTILIESNNWASPTATTDQSFSFMVHRAATVPIGPGTVNLTTGEFTYTATDVAVPDWAGTLTVGRTYASRQQDRFGIFGQGWAVSLPTGPPTASFASVEEQADGSVTLTTASGEGVSIPADGTGGYGPMPAGFEGWSLTKTNGTFKLSDAGGSYTTFAQAAGDTSYVATGSVDPGGTNAATILYQDNDPVIPTEELAPTPAGVSCTPSLSPGCSALVFDYSATADQNSCPPGLGSYGGWLVDEIDDVTFSGTTRVTTPVAVYCYDSTGMLRAEFDPRITPQEATAYTYDARYDAVSGTGGHLVSYTPPGQSAWRFNYETTPADDDPGRLLSVQRTDPGQSSTPTWTVSYGVPLSGSSAPYQMGAADVATWGQQSDVPTSATAIFPPSEVPASTPASDFSQATVYYLDSSGRTVNVASPGGEAFPHGRIATTEYDADDNVIRTLSAVDRQTALNAGAASAVTSELLDTQYIYNQAETADGAPAGSELDQVLGPQHEIELSSGGTAEARQETQYAYDEGAPSGGGPYFLATSTTVGADISGQSEADVRTTVTAYDGQNDLGWRLREPTSVTTDPAGLDLVSTTLYDPTTGMVTETRQPKASASGGDPHTEDTYYYTAGANASDSACGNEPDYANLPCQIRPVAQPGTANLPNLRVTTYAAYNIWDEATSTQVAAGTDTRTTSDFFDGAGRLVGESIQATAGTALPATSYSYDASSGLPTGECALATTNWTSGAACTSDSVSVGYDAVGRTESYQDANGNSASYSYDLDGRVQTVSDNQGTTTYGYDPVSGLLTSLTDSATTGFTFTGSYDADGDLTSETYPNGITKCFSYDADDTLVEVAYQNTPTCGSGAPWYSDTTIRSIHDQELTDDSNVDNEQYAYDAAGRLTQAEATAGGSCQTTQYQYDADDNRTSVDTIPAAGGDGQCDTTGIDGSTSTYAYDSGDRLDDAGVTYNAFGDITGLPASDAGAALTATYYANGQTESLSQSGVTVTSTLDALGRTESQAWTGGRSVTDHYDADGDVPAWTIDQDGHVTRNISDISGGLAALQQDGGVPSLEITNLGGSIVGQVADEPMTGTAAPGGWEPTKSDPYGVPSTSDPAPYAWLGTSERQTVLPSGVIAMGARTYVPQLGRFLQPDPISGASTDAYEYADDDPVNGGDISGDWGFELSNATVAVEGWSAGDTDWDSIYESQAQTGDYSTVVAATLSGGSESSYILGFNFRPRSFTRVWDGSQAARAAGVLTAWANGADPPEGPNPFPEWLTPALLVLSHLAGGPDGMRETAADLTICAKAVGDTGLVTVEATLLYVPWPIIDFDISWERP